MSSNRQRAIDLLGNIVVALLLLVFVRVNFRAYQATHELPYLLVAFSESLYVVFFLVRGRASIASTSMLDWGVAFSATFLSTLFRPANPANLILGTAIVTAGAVLNIASALSLNRSIGLVPALRKVKTGGMYRFVRHPIYLSELLSFLGYILINISALNILIGISIFALQIIRIGREEALLSADEAYREYRARTPWRLVPFIY